MNEQVKASQSLELLSVEQLSVVLHKSPASIRSDASRNPTALPPICRLPGNKRLLWRIEDVALFFAACVQMPSVPFSTQLPQELDCRKARGRPRKAGLVR